MIEGEEPGCLEDCYLCHPGIPLPWWAFQSRRFLVHNQIEVAMRWYQQALASTEDDRWQSLANVEKAIRKAYEVMQVKE